MLKINPQDLSLFDLQNKNLNDFGLNPKMNYLISGGTIQQRRDLMRQIIKKHDITQEPRILEVIPARVVYAMWLLDNVIQYEPNRHTVGIETINSGIVDPQGDLTKIRKDFAEDLIRHGIKTLRSRWDNTDVWLEEFGSTNIDPYGEINYDQSYFGNSNPFTIQGNKNMFWFITTPLSKDEIESKFWILEDRFECIQIDESCERFKI